ncbi:hypothetical protein M0R45_026736 [Rubus argutus]|uniref:Uncharacterized protein n=1 Tax=Rubus argutus TaxID=59490 RepID=A0AAW1WZQ1_RUBAR
MADALISVLLKQLASVVYEYTKEKVTLVLNAEKDVESFSSNLKDIQAVLEDAEKKQVTEARVERYLAIHHHNIARRIKELNDKLTSIANEKEMYGFLQSTNCGPDEQLIPRQKTTSLVDISTIFGREEEKEILLSKLLRESSQEGGSFLVIPIVGMGGMGKTTLTQLVYNHKNVTTHFDKKVWVCVSNPFDEIKIAKAIIENLDGTQSSSNELEIILQHIKTRVETSHFFDRKEDESDGFGTIGAEIVKKCKGLPLIVKTLSSLVWHKKSREECHDVLNSNIWELEEVEEQVFRLLLLSYYDLAPAIKRCLLYCAIFPKDHEFDKDHLIKMWMSQNYLNWKQNQEERRIGQSHFESLVMRSFFQEFRQDDMGNIYGCKMHDVVHDFVLFVTRKECIITEVVQGANQRPSDMVRHLTLTSVPVGPFSFPTSFYNCKSMRSLTARNSGMITISPGSILQMKCLRTLNLSHNNLNELPKEIGELIHLRYLDLSNSEALKELPDAVCDLVNLQTLVLDCCKELEKLPKAMGKLMNLKHLYVWGCGKLMYLPKGIRSLKSLQALDRFYVCDYEEDDEALKLV